MKSHTACLTLNTSARPARVVPGRVGNVRSDKPADALRRDTSKFLAGRLSDAHGKMTNRKAAVLPFSSTDRRDCEDGSVISSGGRYKGMR